MEFPYIIGYLKFSIKVKKKVKLLQCEFILSNL